MKHTSRKGRYDGFYAIADPSIGILPTLGEGKVVPHRLDVPTVMAEPEPDPEYEVDFSTVSCSKLHDMIQALVTLLQVTRFSNPSQRIYYESKLSHAQNELDIRCGGASIGQYPTPDPKNGGSATPTPINPTVQLPTGSTINIGPPSVSPTGGGGSSSKKDDNKKKKNWLPWAVAAALLVALYFSSKE